MHSNFFYQKLCVKTMIVISLILKLCMKNYKDISMIIYTGQPNIYKTKLLININNINNESNYLFYTMINKVLVQMGILNKSNNNQHELANGYKNVASV